MVQLSKQKQHSQPKYLLTLETTWSIKKHQIWLPKTLPFCKLCCRRLTNKRTNTCHLFYWPKARSVQHSNINNLKTLKCRNHIIITTASQQAGSKSGQEAKQFTSSGTLFFCTKNTHNLCSALLIITRIKTHHRNTTQNQLHHSMFRLYIAKENWELITFLQLTIQLTLNTMFI
jgi:hypothetical protein